MPPKSKKVTKAVKEEEEEEVKKEEEMDVDGDDIDGNFFFILGDVKGDKAKTLKKDIEAKGGKLYARITAKVNWLILGDDLSSEATLLKAKKISETDKSVQNYITIDALIAALSANRKFTTDEKKAATDLFQETLKKANDDDNNNNNDDDDDEEDTKPPAKKAKKNDDDDEDKDDDKDDKEESGKKVVVKGKAAVDEYVPEGDSMMVYQEPDTVWDCMLNQTNIAGNNNKFYKIQLLVKEGTAQYFSWTRWGRVGERGQSKLAPMPSLASAKSDFTKKFREKTKNYWENRANFVSYPGKYTLLEIDYNPDEDDDEDGEKKKTKEDEEEEAKKEDEVDSKLDKRVQDLIKLIFDMKMMESILTSEYEFDAKKQPLGKLTKKQIKDGYEVLQAIEKALNSGEGPQTLMELSSRFYTLIPHCFGRMRPPVIDSSEKLKKKMKMLENLADIEIAVKLIKDTAAEEKEKERLAQVDVNYRKLKAELVPLEKDDEEFKLIEKYVLNTHPRCTPKIKCVFRLKREGEHDRFVPKMPLGNRKLLWHGSRLTNFVGILSQGLRIAPPEAPCSGYRFGKGIYFADVCGFASNYCRSYGQKDFLMLLGDVALGKSADLSRDQYMEKPLPGTNSTKALGSEEPDPQDNVTLADGCVVPTGKIVSSGYTNVSCIEHQYIVYDVAQVELRYLVHFNQY